MSRTIFQVFQSHKIVYSLHSWHSRASCLKYTLLNKSYSRIDAVVGEFTIKPKGSVDWNDDQESEMQSIEEKFTEENSL